MGCSCIGISSVAYMNDNIKAGNPDPKNLEIINVTELNGFVIMDIKYIGCKNYEGRKILVYDTSKEDIQKQLDDIGLDPHFSDDLKFISPIARFEPTLEGTIYAVQFCESIKR